MIYPYIRYVPTPFLTPQQEAMLSTCAEAAKIAIEADRKEKQRLVDIEAERLRIAWGKWCDKVKEASRKPDDQ